MNENEKKCYDETVEHINNVSKKISLVMTDLYRRSNEHDQTKLFNPEFNSFVNLNNNLQDIEYNSDEYNLSRWLLGPALYSHYRNNRHHPEHFKNGITDMTLMDLIEMLMDWWSSTERTKNGDIMKSIEYNMDRFKYSDDLKQIFENTIKYFKNTFDIN